MLISSCVGSGEDQQMKDQFGLKNTADEETTEVQE